MANLRALYILAAFDKVIESLRFIFKINVRRNSILFNSSFSTLIFIEHCNCVFNYSYIPFSCVVMLDTMVLFHTLCVDTAAAWAHQQANHGLHWSALHDCDCENVCYCLSRADLSRILTICHRFGGVTLRDKST